MPALPVRTAASKSHPSPFRLWKGEGTGVRDGVYAGAAMPENWLEERRHDPQVPDGVGRGRATDQQSNSHAQVAATTIPHPWPLSLPKVEERGESIIGTPEISEHHRAPDV